jgi:hypothetical protein
MRTLRVTAFAALLLLGLPILASAQAQYGGTNVHFAYAIDYATSQLQGQAPNTYVWNAGSTGPGSCQANPNGGGGPFFVFGPTSKPYPEYIRDSNSSLSEIFDPTGTTLTGSTCGFNGSPANPHTTFWVSSGTAGLYEALYNNIALGASGYAATVILDAGWYRALPGGQTASTVIGSTSAPGSAKVQIVDTTQTPWAWYSWNGTQYVVASSGTAPTLAGPNTFSGVDTFQNALTSFGVALTTTGTLRLYNSGSANYLTVETAAPSGNYVLSFPALSAADTAATLAVANAFTGNESHAGTETFTDGIINTTVPVRDETRQVLVAPMTAVDTAGVNIGSTGAGNATFAFAVATTNWYDLQCKLPVTFVASATISFALVSTSGSSTVSFVNSETLGNTNTSAAFQDLSTFGGTSLAGSATPTTGAPGGVSEMVTLDFQFLTSHAGGIGVKFIGNAANNVQLLEGGECGITQIN